MSKVEVMADVVVCHADITAKAGDMLLVFNGACLGMYRGKTAPDPAIAAMVVAPPEPQQNRHERSHPTGDEIVAAFRGIPATTAEIAERLHIPVGDLLGRRILGERLRKELKRGRLHIVPSDRTRIFLYGPTNPHMGKTES